MQTSSTRRRAHDEQRPARPRHHRSGHGTQQRLAQAGAAMAAQANDINGQSFRR
jgi:hypothetical protein